MAVFASPPLLSVHPAFVTNGKRVATCLDAPLTARVDVREVLCLASVLDVAAERAASVPGAELTQQHRAKLARLEKACRALAPRQSLAEALATLGIASLFPSLIAALAQQQQQQQPSSSSSSSSSLAAHLAYASLLNQVVMMGTQLYNDAVAPSRHKYAAHQIALLYQSLNALQGETKPIRRLIEARFDDVKTISEGPRPTLPADVAAWLQQVTWVCREEVAACPHYVHKRVAPLACAIARVGEAAKMARCSSSSGSIGSIGSSSSGISAGGGASSSCASTPTVKQQEQQQQQQQQYYQQHYQQQQQQPQSCHEQLQQLQLGQPHAYATAACS